MFTYNELSGGIWGGAVKYLKSAIYVKVQLQDSLRLTH